MDPLDVLRADLDAFMQEQRRHQTKASSSTKARNTRVMRPASHPPAPPAISRAGPFFSPVATPTFSPVAPHEAENLVGDIGFPSFFKKQASVPPTLTAFTSAEFRAWLIEFRFFLTRFQLHGFLDRVALLLPRFLLKARQLFGFYSSKLLSQQ